MQSPTCSADGPHRIFLENEEAPQQSPRPLPDIVEQIRVICVQEGTDLAGAREQVVKGAHQAVALPRLAVHGGGHTEKAAAVEPDRRLDCSKLSSLLPIESPILHPPEDSGGRWALEDVAGTETLWKPHSAT